MKKVLIGYYSKTGTTRKVCEEMKEILEQTHFEVDFMELSQITELSADDTVVIAAPINGMQWVEPAKSFVMANAKTLKDKKFVAIYVSYIIRTGNGFWKKKIKNGIEKLTMKMEPLVIKDFGGVVDKEFPGFARLIFGITKGTSLDMSNEKEVKSFTEDLIKMISI